LAIGIVLPDGVAVDDRDPRSTGPWCERVDEMTDQRVIPSA
jgi:hypothetical protein